MNFKLAHRSLLKTAVTQNLRLSRVLRFHRVQSRQSENRWRLDRPYCGGNCCNIPYLVDAATLCAIVPAAMLVIIRIIQDNRDLHEAAFRRYSAPGTRRNRARGYRLTTRSLIKFRPRQSSWAQVIMRRTINFDNSAHVIHKSCRGLCSRSRGHKTPLRNRGHKANAGMPVCSSGLLFLCGNVSRVNMSEFHAAPSTAKFSFHKFPFDKKLAARPTGTGRPELTPNKRVSCPGG
jgi:hypothetical protein